MKNPSPNKLISIYSTFPSREEAEKVAACLLNEKLIACANIFPKGISLYQWEGKVQKEEEVFVFFKTCPEKTKKALKRIHELHPYQVPALLQFQVEANLDYSNWAQNQLH